ncbi:NAD-glutamate dehydrogenase [Altericroceibacterium xinjiangense]|uniref:NAD-glutamate dehydrogenase n=1 Tax=Altericroceibacterium xinjiangense TaxID=762261 RepID=UPI000F7E8B63|nr:NAD-glutamate dehydrogenase domain-containing protein [Altericroceibacterium xinjiangense]
MATPKDGMAPPQNERANDSALANELARRIEGSILPGEAPPPEGHLAEVAEFLLEAARHRQRGHASILMRSGQLQTESGPKRQTRIAVVNDDMPFLVDSVASTVAAAGLDIDQLVHPIVPVRRDASGQIVGISAEGGDSLRESMLYLETARVDARERRALEHALGVTIADVRAAVGDWPKMQIALLEDVGRVFDEEGGALLRWLAEGKFTQLGHLTRRRDGTVINPLGICRESARDLLAEESYRRAFAWFAKEEEPRYHAPLIIKANLIANVHRRAPLDLLIVPVVEQGELVALSIHAGLWTSAALAAPPQSVPLLRKELKGMMDQLGFDPTSHDGKSLIHALTALPHDLIIGFSEADILRITTTMMSLSDRPRARLALVAAPLQRHLFAFVWLPRDMLSTSTRLQIQSLLEKQTGADTLAWSLAVEGGNLAMLRYVIDIRDHPVEPDEEAIDRQLQDMLRGWGDAVERELSGDMDAGRAAAISARFAEAFPPSYRTSYGAEQAAHDIERIRRLSAGEQDRPLGRDVRLCRLDRDAPGDLRLRVFQLGGVLPLSDAVPALENFGFRVMSEMPIELAGDIGTIHDFRVSLPAGDDTAPVLARSEAIEEAIAGVLNGLAEDDVFNRLVIGTALEATEANWLRAFYRYLRQAGIGFTIYTVVDALRCAPDVTRGLIELIKARHDPSLGGEREQAASQALTMINQGLQGVAAINDDRLLRLYRDTICAMLRTNAFSTAAGEALAFKFDSSQVPGLPKPIPWRDIFVYSRRVEGIHLRAGPVARGGLRWSDRRDDFRTEVLGLMKAQRVKNAIIVPTGAKGGFYPKQLPDPASDREAWAAEGRAAYEIFIRSLLSLTDNSIDGKVIHPDGVVIRDGDDPYFVVAADKGTATFSDVANALAEERDFWLGDAFASGGSKGYDHKAMGITAKGAWISVQRHFLEMGVDVQSEPVRVAGCGDMSGDVFGNGMLLSRAIKLVAAFDHRHVFIDPDPDPAASFAERQRLFDLPRSSWADYDPALISRGGGVFPRTMKQIPLSQEARAALGIDAEELDPDTLIAHILKSPVDLLWFGGIGTYVKSDAENNVQVGDPANDALRVNGEDLRAKVIGEGANLAVTQAGRIEFALNGGRINTDFIDNSAGVDCSDNEVNIKIALAGAKRAGDLTEEGRVELLAEMTDDVSELVQEDNRLQALALSIAQIGGATAVASQSRLIETLEDLGDLDRRTEGLAEAETLARRAADGEGLTRPELAVLLSNAKIVLQDAVEGSRLAEDSALERYLLSDFPRPMQYGFPEQILHHPLRREIIATVVANRMVNRMGLVHPFELAEEEGTSLESVAAAFVSAEKLFGFDQVWDVLDTAPVPELTRPLLFEQAAMAMRGHLADLLRAGAGLAPPSVIESELAEGVNELSGQVDELLAEEGRRHALRIAEDLTQQGTPPEIAQMVARLFALDGLAGLARLARDTGISPVTITHAFVNLGERLGLYWAQSKAAVMNPSDPWERLLVAGLARDFQQMRFDFLRRMAPQEGGADPIAMVDRWAEGHEDAIRHFRGMIGRAQSASPVAPAMLAQIASQARNLLQR